MKHTILIALCVFLSSCSHWRYQTIDKTTTLGRSSTTLSITIGKVTASFRIPKGFKVKSCADQHLDSHYLVFSKNQKLGFTVFLYKGFSDTPLVERHQKYLDGIHGTHDDDVVMSPAPKLYLKDGSTVTPYLYFSPYWGHRLVVKITYGVYTTTFEFSSSKDLETRRPTIESVIRSFSYTAEQGAAANP
jgi:hypothetical protein